jgi:hypothetical protein
LCTRKDRAKLSLSLKWSNISAILSTELVMSVGRGCSAWKRLFHQQITGGHASDSHRFGF